MIALFGDTTMTTAHSQQIDQKLWNYCNEAAQS